jgi:predicted glycogen debranching enzyme
MSSADRIVAATPSSLVRRIGWQPGRDTDTNDLERREWLVTNGLGGYASGTIVGAITRRYHGLLIAALPAPLGRVMLVNHVSERLRFEDYSTEWLGAHGRDGRLAQAEGTQHLVEFRLEAGLPVWRYSLRGVVLERTLLMPYGQNSVHLTYRLVEGRQSIRLGLRPLMGFRPHDAPVDRVPVHGYTLTARDRRIEIHGEQPYPPLRLALHAADGAFTVDDYGISDVRYLLEESRGYEPSGPLWSPGYFRAQLAPDRDVTLIASTESWETIAAINPVDALAMEHDRRTRLVAAAHPVARSGVAAELVLAADHFIIRPSSRTEDEARARASGGEARTVIAGYHWFTDWGRDTMISLEGLTLLTGRHTEARDILRTFAFHVRDGLIPNMFPEGEREGLYHTADATLWFFHAIDRYEGHIGDRTLVRELLPTLLGIVQSHIAGTRFGIRADSDGLLTQGAEGYQLTWMDAKVDGWVVTPRRGKAVEINALWYNALCVLERWLRDAGDARVDEIARYASAAYASFNTRFWNASAGFLFDVIDGEHGDDAACRPNQVIALSLPHPALDRSRWGPVLHAVATQLLTPFGLRSLAPSHPDYKPRYFGDLRTRDAAYHQGTVWAWLIGPFIDAWLKVHPEDRGGARRLLASLTDHMNDACIGSISEIFDAEEPFTPRGCIAQAWSVAEVLRALVRVESTALHSEGRELHTSERAESAIGWGPQHRAGFG